MNVRLFEWRDFPTLHHHRKQCVFLHSALLFTRGAQLIPDVIFSTFSSTSGIITAIATNLHKDTALIGQTHHTAGSKSAQLNFLTPFNRLDSPDLPSLLDFLAGQVGERGAYRLIADVDEESASFEIMRRCGYAIYTRQRIWKLKWVNPEHSSQAWQPPADQDIVAINSLFHNVVPGLVQQVEAIISDHLHGLVYRQGDEVLAYAELKYGQRGIWVQPLCHPDIKNAGDMINGLIQHIPNRNNKPVYLCIRSYLSWLEPVLETIGAECGPRQAVMVKQLTVPIKVLRTVKIPAIESGHPEVSAPIAHSERHH